MTHDEVQEWLDDYLEAWSSNDPARIGALFTEDAVYSYRPWRSEEHTARGREAIVAGWLENPDDPADWEAEYAPYAVDGAKAVAVGWTRYEPIGEHPGRTYHNAFLLRFGDEGRCSEFAEFYLIEKD
ncbi:MAG: nuclear transport factor 2 family protein [Acidimicrobiia bacterium]